MGGNRLQIGGTNRPAAPNHLRDRTLRTRLLAGISRREDGLSFVWDIAGSRVSRPRENRGGNHNNRCGFTKNFWERKPLLDSNLRNNSRIGRR